MQDDVVAAMTAPLVSHEKEVDADQGCHKA